MVQNGFVVEFTAAAGREDEVAAFLISARAMVEREPETITWFAFRKDDRTFGIFDAFETEEGRAFHLQGEVRQVIDANGDLFAVPPTITPVDLVAAKLPQ